MRYILTAYCLFLLASCTNTPQTAPILRMEGETMGTTFSIEYRAVSEKDYSHEVKPILRAVNQEVSTYITNSDISTFNQAATNEVILKKEGYFYKNIKLAQPIYKNTNGAFDPTVMPLVNYWGFGYTPKRAVTQVDSAKIDSILTKVGFDKIILKGDTLKTTVSGVQLDLSAIAKGGGVDALSEFLEAQGVQDYMVEIGGETRTKGNFDTNKPWIVGVNTPNEKAGVKDYQVKIKLDNIAVATSGNYRNFHEIDGQKYGHTINPKTGYPQKTKILSASIFAKDCATADAYATACMVLDTEKAWALIQNTPEIEAYLIVISPEGKTIVKASPKVKTWIVE